jgi:hypothetical protein
LESAAALAVHVRVTRCPPFTGGVEGTIEAFSGGQLGFEPAPGELFACACTCWSASLRLRACSSLWAGDGFAAVRHPEQLICVVLAIAMATKAKKTEGLHLARIRSGKRDFMPRNGRCARILFLFKTFSPGCATEKKMLAHSGAISTTQRTCSPGQGKKRRFRPDDGVFPSNTTDPHASQALQSQKCAGHFWRRKQEWQERSPAIFATTCAA